MKRALTLTVVSLAFLALGPAVASAGNEEDLYGKKYRAISVTKDGQPYQLVEGTRLWVDFHHRGGGTDVTWRAGCNLFGAAVEIGGNTLDVGPITSTQMACPGRMDQDRFFARFFANDPTYEAGGRSLSLSTERVQIELRRRAG